jgi:hypothetical protein
MENSRGKTEPEAMPNALLKAKEIAGLLKKPGKHRDGAGLFL